MRSATGSERQGLVLDGLFLRAAHAVGHFEQSLCRVRTPVEHHVLDGFAQIERDVLIDAQLSGVDDSHVHAGAGGVVEEDGVNRLAHGVVSPEREGDVAYASADVGEWETPPELARRLDERDSVAVMLLDAGGDGEDVGVEDDVLGREADLLGQDAVGTFADGDLALDRVGLAALVERHNDDSRSVTPDDARLPDELVLALLERD